MKQFFVKRSTKVSRQVTLFGSPHFLFLGLRLIAVSTKVQGPVEDHPVQFRLKGYPQFPGIILNPVDADIDLPRNALPLGKVEGDNIRVIVVLQVLPVYIKETPV